MFPMQGPHPRLPVISAVAGSPGGELLPATIVREEAEEVTVAEAVVEILITHTVSAPWPGAAVEVDPISTHRL